MGDLLLGMTIMLALTLLLGGGTWLLTRRTPMWGLDLLAGLVIVGIQAYVYLLRDNVVLARLLPYTNLLIVGNWLPLFAGILAGLLVRRIKGRPTSQFLWVVLLLVTGLFALVAPFRGRTPNCENQWVTVCRGCQGFGRHDDTLSFCYQTSTVTCSPAAACTLLSEYGIVRRERDLAESSLTREGLAKKGGTMWQGLYRGLRMATRDTEWTVEVFDTDLETLVAMPGPKLLFVELIPGSGYDPRYATEWGWNPGRRHTVVFYARVHSDRFMVGDPAVGIEPWSRKDMDTLWHGRGMRLVRR